MLPSGIAAWTLVNCILDLVKEVWREATYIYNDHRFDRLVRRVVLERGH
jgi:hypothetical protein